MTFSGTLSVMGVEMNPGQDTVAANAKPKRNKNIFIKLNQPITKTEADHKP